MTDTSQPGRGRPLTYTVELAETICAELVKGRTLRAVCRDEGMPPEGTVRLWALDDRDGFAARYAKAREIGYLTMADELLEIADDDRGDLAEVGEDGRRRMDTEFVGRSRLKLDTRKWLLSKALPKLYGDKLAVTGADGGALKSEVTVIELVAPSIDNNAGREDESTDRDPA